MLRMMMHGIDAWVGAVPALIYRFDQNHFPCRSVVHRTTGIFRRTVRTALHAAAPRAGRVSRPVLPAAGNVAAPVLPVLLLRPAAAGSADRDALLPALDDVVVARRPEAVTRHVFAERESDSQ